MQNDRWMQRYMRIEVFKQMEVMQRHQEFQALRIKRHHRPNHDI
jgi:hypothetical protein